MTTQRVIQDLQWGWTHSDDISLNDIGTAETYNMNSWIVGCCNVPEMTKTTYNDRTITLVTRYMKQKSKTIYG